MENLLNGKSKGTFQRSYPHLLRSTRIEYGFAFRQMHKHHNNLNEMCQKIKKIKWKKFLPLEQGSGVCSEI